MGRIRPDGYDWMSMTKGIRPEDECDQKTLAGFRREKVRRTEVATM